MPRFLFPLLFLPFGLFAQLPKALDKTTVIWAGYVQQDFLIDHNSITGNAPNWQRTIKIFNNRNDDSLEEETFLATLVYEAALSGAFPIYEDPECTKPVSPKDRLIMSDTTVTFDPETFKEKVSTTRSRPDLNRLAYWRVRYLLYYDSETASWGAANFSVALMIHSTNMNTMETRFRTLCWFRAESGPVKPTTPSVLWAKTLFPVDEPAFVRLNEAKMVKQSGGANAPYQNMLEVCRNRPALPLYSADEWTGGRLMTMEERIRMAQRADTTVITNPQTFEKTFHIERKQYTATDILGLRVVQTWYWDDKQRRLYIHVPAVGPMVSYYSSSTGRQLQYALFYRKL